jgi:hypothetical protein
VRDDRADRVIGWSTAGAVVGLAAADTDAARWFVRTAALVADRWDRPGLGEWDVRALVGRTSRALLTVET